MEFCKIIRYCLRQKMCQFVPINIDQRSNHGHFVFIGLTRRSTVDNKRSG
jgi:hypothetical protein